jgi:hypothetical protein
MNQRLAAWRLLCTVLTPCNETGRVSLLRREIQFSEEMWPEVIRLANAHLVTPAVWVGLKRNGLIEYLSEEPRQYLKCLYEMNARRNNSLVHQLEEAICVLNRRGIVPVLLKGSAYLKAGIYDDTAVRILSDLDLLVEEPEIPSTFEALCEVGYHVAAQSDTYAPPHRHCRPLVRAGAFGCVEVHRRLVRADLEEILPTNLARNALVERSEHGMRYRCLSPSHMVILSFLHSQMIDRCGETFTIGLRAIQDLVALETAYRKLINWEEIYAQLTRYGMQRCFRDYLFAASCTVGLTLLPEIRFGPREWAHYGIAHARIRWERLERLSTALSSDSIGRRYRPSQNLLTLNFYRLLFICNLISMKVRGLLPTPTDLASGQRGKD